MRIGIREAFLSVSPRVPGMSLEEFATLTEEFEVTPLFHREECRGAMMVRGKEVHACVTPPWYARQALRVINAVIKEHGEAITHATTDEGIRMVEKLGFVKCSDGYRSTKTWE